MTQSEQEMLQMGEDPLFGILIELPLLSVIVDPVFIGNPKRCTCNMDFIISY